MKRYIGHIIHSTERFVGDFLRSQIKNEKRADYGALPSEMIEAKPTVYVLASAVSLYCNKDSSMYLSDELYDGINIGLDFVKRCQREDGSFDFPSCNFMSAADTAFCFKRLIGAYRLLDKYECVLPDKAGILKEKYYSLLYNAMTIITEGGFHTPNHRWAICAALMQGINMFPNHPLREKMAKRLDMYLNEGLDGNEDGEYAERSSGNYNAVVNNAMLIMHEENQKLGIYKKNIDFLSYVKRNLHMMLHFIDTDGSIFTQNSTRQDYGRLIYMDKYFYQYLYIAAYAAKARDCEGEGDCVRDEYGRAAHKIIMDNLRMGREAPDCLFFLMQRDEMLNYEFGEYGFLDTYSCFYRNSGVGRVKTDKYVYSVLKGSSSFLYFKTNDTLIAMKIGESIGSVRNFIPDEIKQTDKGFVLKSRVQAAYYEPFSEKPDTSDWWSMKHEDRNVLIKGSLDVIVTITQQENGLDIGIHAEGLRGVPLRVEFIVQPGSDIYNEHFRLTAGRGQSIILKDGYANIRHNNDILRINGGFGTHSFKGHYNGEESMEDVFVIFMNDYTPFDRTAELRVVRE